MSIVIIHNIPSNLRPNPDKFCGIPQMSVISRSFPFGFVTYVSIMLGQSLGTSILGGLGKDVSELVLYFSSCRNTVCTLIG